nr:protein argonaute 12-like [Rhipicephalus microplus]
MAARGPGRGGGVGRGGGPRRGRGRARDGQHEPPPASQPGRQEEASFIEAMRRRAAQAEQPIQARPQRGGAGRGHVRSTAPPPVAEQVAREPQRQHVVPGPSRQPMDMGALEETLPAAPEKAVVPRQTTFPVRPDKHGKLGRPIELLANHFAIQLPDGDVYHYDVTIIPPSKKEARFQWRSTFERTIQTSSVTLTCLAFNQTQIDPSIYRLKSATSWRDNLTGKN